MASLTGSKGGFIVNNSYRDRLVELRREHGHFLALELNKIDSKHKACMGNMAKVHHKNLEITYSKTTNKNNDIR